MTKLISTGRAWALGLACAAGLAMAGHAGAEDMSVELRNSQPGPLEAELYSQARPQNWPGAGALYRLEPGTTQALQLSCIEGESICYGAWAPGNESLRFGVGPDGVEKCEDCCFTCDGGARAAFDIK